MRNKSSSWIEKTGIIAMMMVALAPAVKAQPYFMYWFAEAFGTGVHGGTRTIDFIVFFALFTSIIYLGAKNLFGDKEKPSRAVIVLAASLGLILTMALLMNTQFSLMLFFPFAKNLIFFIFFFILYLFLIKYGGMEKNKVWAFIAALIISFLIFNVGSCFINEKSAGGTCSGGKLLDTMGKPFAAIGKWFGGAFDSGKKGVNGVVKDVENGVTTALDDTIPKDTEELLKTQSCKQLVDQAENPDLLCKAKEVAVDIYNLCTGGKDNAYSDITRWRLASEKCTQQYNSADATQKKQLQKDYDKSRTNYVFLQGLKAKEGGNYDEAIRLFDSVISDTGSSSNLVSKAKGLKSEAETAKVEKEQADKIKSANDNIAKGEELASKASGTTDPDAKLEFYKQSIAAYTQAKADAQSIGGAKT